MTSYGSNKHARLVEMADASASKAAATANAGSADQQLRRIDANLAHII